MSRTIFLAGDTMLGRGIDQLMPQSSGPELYEPHIKDAREYLRLAERAGVEPRPFGALGEVWGAAAEAIAARRPDASILNLETSATAGGTPDPEKGIHYRMHPANAGALAVLPAHCAVLANNHVLDWGSSGLVDTLQALQRVGVAAAGAGRSAGEARRPAVLPLADGGRAVVTACAAGSSGVPQSWAAGRAHAGVWLAERPDRGMVAEIAEAFDTESGASSRDTAGGSLVQPAQPSRELRVCSIHWGANWGYRVPPEQRRFAHALIDEAGVDLVFGHSSHHPKAVEVYHDRLILYGCGDFINDYEGIPGHEEFRPEISAGYFATIDDSGALEALEIVPFLIRGFRLHEADSERSRWLADTLSREGERFGTAFRVTDAGSLAWVRRR